MFKLEIEMGNDAMQTPMDIAEALRAVAQSLENYHRPWGAETLIDRISDTNGNKVGVWTLTK